MIKAPFQHKKILTKEDLNSKKKKTRAENWKYSLLRLWQLMEERKVALEVMKVSGELKGYLVE